MLVVICSLLLLANADAPARSSADPTARSHVDATADFMQRLHATKWPYESLKDPPARVERDDKQNIIRLRLDGMVLKPGDLDLICGMTDIVNLSLCRTNITDEQIQKLSALHGLQHLQLNHTAISDRAIPSLAKLPALRSLCLGGVKVSPDGIKSLHSAKPKLSMGYFPEDK